MDNVRAVFDRPALAEALRLVGRVQPWRRAVPQTNRDGKPIPPKMPPGVVRIDVEASVARLTVANFDMAISVDLDCDGLAGTMFLPLTPLTSFVDKGKGGSVELTTGDGQGGVATVCGRTRAATFAESFDAPAQLPPIGGDEHAIDADVMRRGLASTEGAAHDDTMRPWLGGVYIHDTAAGPAFVARDDARLHVKAMDGAALGVSAILPRAAAKMLLGMLPEEGRIAMRMDQRGASFGWGRALLRTKLIDGQYPAFRQPSSIGGDGVLRANAAALAGDLELVACVADAKLQEISLDLGGECFARASRAIAGMGLYAGTDSGQVLLDAEFTGKPMSIRFQLRLVTDALHLFGEHEIEWKMGGEREPTVISSPHVPGTEAMVSPLLPAGTDQRVAA